MPHRNSTKSPVVRPYVVGPGICLEFPTDNPDHTFQVSLEPSGKTRMRLTGVPKRSWLLDSGRLDEVPWRLRNLMVTYWQEENEGGFHTPAVDVPQFGTFKEVRDKKGLLIVRKDSATTYSFVGEDGWVTVESICKGALGVA